MLTTLSYKESRGINDTAFKRLVNKALTAHPELTREDIVIRRTNTVFEVLKPELLDEYLPTKQSTTAQPTSTRWAIVPRQTAEIQVQDERTGEWLDVYSETTAVQIDESKANVSEAREAMQLLDIQAQSIRSATQASELQAMQDELNRYRLMAKYKKLMKAKIDAEESNTPFTLGNELDRIATALGV